MNGAAMSAILTRGSSIIDSSESEMLKLTTLLSAPVGKIATFPDASVNIHGLERACHSRISSCRASTEIRHSPYTLHGRLGNCRLPVRSLQSPPQGKHTCVETLCNRF